LAWMLIPYHWTMQKAKKGVKVTITHLIIKAVASAVSHSHFNSISCEQKCLVESPLDLTLVSSA